MHVVTTGVPGYIGPYSRRLAVCYMRLTLLRTEPKPTSGHVTLVISRALHT